MAVAGWEGWNRETEDYLKYRWGDVSAAEIATELDSSGNLSRNGVIGKGHRLGLGNTGTRGVRVQPRKPRRPRALPEIPNTSMRLQPPGEQASPPPEPARERDQFGVLEPDGDAGHDSDLPDLRPACACTLLDLTARTCRWPHGDPQSGDFYFCGAPPLDAVPYCGPHSRMAYNGRPRP